MLDTLNEPTAKLAPANMQSVVSQLATAAANDANGSLSAYGAPGAYGIQDSGEYKEPTTAGVAE